MNEIYTRVNYKSPRNFIINEFIREFDISKANINILRMKNVISEEDYNYLYHCDRMERQIKIGLLQRDNPDVVKILQNGIIEAKKSFFEANDIKDSEVLQIRNDAVFLLNRDPEIKEFDLVNFRLKNVYTSFYKTSQFEFFYFQDQIKNIESLNVTGINDNTFKEKVIPLHQDYFLDFLLTVFDMAQNCSIQEVISLITSFYNQYINRELDIGYYREFNSDSMYKIVKFSMVDKFQYMIPSIDKKQLKYIDIENNRLIIQDLFKIFSNLN